MIFGQWVLNILSLCTYELKSNSQVSCSALPDSLLPPNSRSCVSVSCNRHDMSRPGGLGPVLLSTDTGAHCQSTYDRQDNRHTRHKRQDIFVCYDGSRDSNAVL